MKKITLYANFSYKVCKELVKRFEEKNYEVKQIFSSSSTPILITDTGLMYSGYGHILLQFELI
jgi:hypothetical protein